MKQDTFSKQVPIALIAIGSHISKNQLANPASIDISNLTETIRIRVPEVADQEAWVTSAIIEGEHNEPYGPIAAGWVKTTWSLRLPDLGIAVELRGLRPAPLRTLMAVPA